MPFASPARDDSPLRVEKYMLQLPVYEFYIPPCLNRFKSLVHRYGKLKSDYINIKYKLAKTNPLKSASISSNKYGV